MDLSRTARGESPSALLQGAPGDLFCAGGKAPNRTFDLAVLAVADLQLGSTAGFALEPEHLAALLNDSLVYAENLAAGALYFLDSSLNFANLSLGW